MATSSNFWSDNDLSDAFLNEYNKQIDEAEAEIDAGDYVDHNDVEKLFTDRRAK